MLGLIVAAMHLMCAEQTTCVGRHHVLSPAEMLQARSSHTSKEGLQLWGKEDVHGPAASTLRGLHIRHLHIHFSTLQLLKAVVSTGVPHMKQCCRLQQLATCNCHSWKS